MTKITSTNLSFGHLAALACQIEACVPKPGNVHRSADFADTTLYDFLLSGQLLGQTIDEHLDKPLGELILHAAAATREQVGKNTNLGIILLLCPLAKFLSEHRRHPQLSMHEWLGQRPLSDSRDVLAAIRLANPGGLGRVDCGDANDSASDNLPLVELMQLASSRDHIARQFSHGFADVFDWFVPQLQRGVDSSGSLLHSIIATHVRWIAASGDSLIARKLGEAGNREAQTRAKRAIDCLESGWTAFETEVAELDFWMRCDGNRRNPGSTADLICAGLFAGWHDGRLPLEIS